MGRCLGSPPTSVVAGEYWLALRRYLGVPMAPAAPRASVTHMLLRLTAAAMVYVADTYNFTVRKIMPAGVVTTLAGLAGNTGSIDGKGSGARFSYWCG